MLHIITGRTGSGKTRNVRKIIADNARTASNKSIIIVPEQFTFETERAMLDLLGNDKINNVEVTSFSHLAEKLLKDEGRLPKKSINDGVRSILMSMSVEDAGENVPSFERYVTNVSVIHDLVSFRKEMKKCCIPIEELENFSESDINSSFQKRVKELSQIFKSYDALIEANYGDDTEYLNLLYKLLNEKHCFKGKTVAIDAFSGFNKQEYNILENILIDADDVYVTFCYDSEKNNGRYELFHNTTKEIQRLKKSAQDYNIEVASQELYVTDRKYKAESLYFLEENLFSNKQNAYEKDAANIALIECQIKKDECDCVAAEIKRLVREENYRYKDIAIIERTEESYKNELLSSFRKYNINCFTDNRQPIDTQPVIVFVRSLFKLMILGFRTDLVMQYIKTGLLGLSVEDIALIEDYTYTWSIKQSQWTAEWKNNPDGFSDKFDDYQIRKLKRINEIRESIVGPIISLKNKMNQANGQHITSLLFGFLKALNVSSKLKQIALDLEKYGSDLLSVEQGTIWKILIEILDSLYYAIGERDITIKRYYDLFEILVASMDVGVIPNAIDEVILGSADRIRAAAPRAVFVVGANMGVFPNYTSGGVLFNDKERCKMIDNGIELVSNMEYNSVNEMFIAYHALTLATDRLYLSYSTLSNSDDKLYPSELVTMVKRITPNCTMINSKDHIRRVESKSSAFSMMAKESKNASELYASIYEYFDKSDNKQYARMIEKCNKGKFSIDDKEIAKKLFGTNITTSASRIERYYKCHFMYFCEHGLKAKARKHADIDPAQAGTIIHFVMEKALSENPKERFIELSNDDLTKLADEIVDRYITENMSGCDEKSPSFIRKIKLIKKTSATILKQLVYEFRNCDFTPVDFELGIGDDVDSYEIQLDGGATVKLRGKVDRVDTYESNGNTYLRIIDYKSSGQDFRLSDIYYGLNMQMLIYLFALWQNGGSKYKNIVPSGILYYPAKEIIKTETTRVTSDEMDETVSRGKMNGMVLDNVEIINAMDHIGNTFINAKLTKEGMTSGNTISLEYLEKLKDKVNSIIKEMIYGLYNGDIEVYPVRNGDKMSCAYCDYHDICRHEENDAVKVVEKLKHEEALEILGGELDA